MPEDQNVDQGPIKITDPQEETATAVAAVIYFGAFVVGAIVMSFEMLGSRYLNPYFGSGIYTWASLISTVLAALTAGYFLGGVLADRTASAPVLGATVLVGAVYLLALPSFAQPMLEFVLDGIDDVRAGSLLSAMAIMLFPVTFLGMYSPFAIRLLLHSARRSGVVSGTVYGVSTAGSIVGTLGTTFLLIPLIGTRAITYSLGAAGVLCGLLLVALPRLRRRAAVLLACIATTALLAVPAVRADDLVDLDARAAMLKRADGRVAHVETEYNDIFITKRREILTMSFQLKGWDYTESASNLRDPDDLPIRYTQVMTMGVAHPGQIKKVLMLGLGGGSISTYLGRFMPDVEIETVEIDPRVIETTKTYFGVRETPRVRYLASDGRVFLTRSKDLYDLILVDAYHGGFVPFHLLTREFYTLVKQHLTPEGAAAFNVHDGTKLYSSTVKTMADVFPALDIYSTWQGEAIIVVGAGPALSREQIVQRARELQSRYKFRFSLPDMIERRIDKPRALAEGGTLITDDFAPVNLYDTLGDERPKRK